MSQTSMLRKFQNLALCPGSQPMPGYLLRSLRGRGSFGEVWSADGPGGKQFALKFIPNRFSRIVVQELRNLQMFKSLEHPNILKFHQIWCHSGYVIVSMDLADGSLLDVLDYYKQEIGTAVEARHACQLLMQAAQALDFLNNNRELQRRYHRGFQHCDIKPSNLLLFEDTVRVADFGIATRMNMNVHTQSLGGTTDYCAPEAYLGRVSTQTDQFSLAATYCHLRGGRVPFKPTPDNVFNMQFWLSPDLSMLPSEEQNLVARALHPHPERRWSSCTQFLTNLMRVVELLS